MKLSIVLLAFVIMSSLAFAEDCYERTITVGGHSEIIIEAESATINTAIKVVEDDMDEGFKKLEKIIQSVVKELVALGINEKDIDRSIITQGKETQYMNGKHEFMGYFAQSLIKIKLKKINRLSKVYKLLSNYEDMRTQGVIFDRSDIFKLKLKEYEKALKLAKIKAETMVRTLGSKLGKVKTISSSTISSMVARSSGVTDRNFSINAVSVANVGFITISAQVSVIFYIED